MNNTGKYTWDMASQNEEKYNKQWTERSKHLGQKTQNKQKTELAATIIIIGEDFGGFQILIII